MIRTLGIKKRMLLIKWCYYIGKQNAKGRKISKEESGRGLGYVDITKTKYHHIVTTLLTKT